MMFYKKNETGYRVVMGGIRLTTFATKTLSDFVVGNKD